MLLVPDGRRHQGENVLHVLDVRFRHEYALYCIRLRT